jgi:hypothetical protein
MYTDHQLELRHLGLQILELNLGGLQFPTLAFPALNLHKDGTWNPRLNYRFYMFWGFPDSDPL